MAPSPLHGLNIIQTEPTPDQYGDSGQDPLLANAHFPDLAAQLDLWSNLTFQSDEPPSARKSITEDEQTVSGDEDRDDDAAEVEGPALLEAHVNAVNPTIVPTTQGISHQPHPNYDMGAFLTNFGVDSFLLPQVAPQPPPQAATLAQLLASYPLGSASFLPHLQASAVTPAALSTPTQQQHQQSPAPSASGSTTQTKRSSRQHKISSRVSSPTEGDGESSTGATQALSAAEDKRRRNTAASARFRLKKKEREAALERRAQELEIRVNTLERECEGLRRENGWLKGLVVGVTGASQGAQVASSPSPSPGQAKRKRSTEDTNGKEESKKVAVSA